MSHKKERLAQRQRNINIISDTVYIRQLSSSDPSGQWYSWSHFNLDSIHVPSSHLNSSAVHSLDGGFVGTAVYHTYISHADSINVETPRGVFMTNNVVVTLKCFCTLFSWQLSSR